MRVIKLPQVGLEFARLLTTRHKFVCFDVTSRVDIDCARSSLCQGFWLSRESIRMEIRGSWVRLPCETDFISRFQKPEHSIKYHIHIIYMIYIYTYIYHIYIHIINIIYIYIYNYLFRIFF